MNDLVASIEHYGGNPESLLRFDSADTPELLPYATLIGARQGNDADLQALIAVYEWQDNPLIYLVDAARISDGGKQLQRIRRRVALHGDAPYLGVLDAGRLTVHALGIDRKTPQRSTIALDVEEAIILPYLATARPKMATARGKWIADLIHSLLKATLSNLLAAGISEQDAISLAGAALFTRFLADRDLLRESPCPNTPVDALFDNAETIKQTCAWLDDTFNGNLLPLSPDVWAHLGSSACHSLGNILRRADSGQLHLGWEQRWDYLDFAHIPVGVLSQAYEGYLREHASARQKKQGSFYTPLPIAETLVRGAFFALQDEGRAHTAKVLDPAAGAGVFLITAYRQLAAAHWHHTGDRPDTATLRSILYNQLTGFDIDEAGLRFAALGLYLMAIELDAQPEPIKKLHFDHDLRQSVLWKVGDIARAKEGGLIGSLGDAVGDEHLGQYDLVVGNPPWTGARRVPGWAEVKKRVAEIARSRLGPDTPPPPIPNEVGDLPFLWRAMEWARPDGQIALALHARLLFQQGDGMPEARQALFSAVDVSSVINASELRNTKVWPQISAPFCLLFARNRVAAIGARFRFLSPHVETGLNGAGIMRLDPTNAEIVGVSQLRERPTILKTMFRGTRLDLDLLERISRLGLPTVDGYWRTLFGTHRGRARQTGNGYQRLRKSTLKIQPTGQMVGLPNLDKIAADTPLVDRAEYETFTPTGAHRAREFGIYGSPLVILSEAPPVETQRVCAIVRDTDTVYDESHYGYSTAGHPHAALLARYLGIVLRSRFTLWHALMVSGEFGFERETIEKSTIDSLPIVPYENLGHDQLARLTELSDALSDRDDAATWSDADQWVATLYGLNGRDLQVIDDTLAYHLPFASNRHKAQMAADAALQEAFITTLAAELRPWQNPGGGDLDIRTISDLPADSPWQLLHISSADAPAGNIGQPSRQDWAAIIHLADQNGAAEIEHETESGLWIARLRQAQYWSHSQARLLAQRLVWDHGQHLFGGT